MDAVPKMKYAVEARTSMEVLDTPVALFVFNRPSTTQRVFDAVAMAQPATLLLVADGVRPGKEGEAEACRLVREIVTRVDWPCEVHCNFAETNLGCQERIISGLNWVFSLVEEAIILEDDCLPDASFFPFCQELLARYRGDSRIAAISGTNLVEKYVRCGASYFFSELGGIWGWATWRSRWQQYDRDLTDWPQIKSENQLAEVFDKPESVNYWTQIFDAMHEKRGPDTWDYQWVYTHLIHNQLTAVPRVNLVANIGFGDGATHTATVDSRLTPTVKAIDFPLTHPVSFIPSRSVDRRFQDLYRVSLSQRVLRKMRSTFKATSA